MASNYRTWGWSGSGYGERIYLEIWHSRTDINTNKSTFGYKIYNNSYNSYGDTGDISWRISDQWNSSRVSGSLKNTPTTAYYQVKNYASGTFQITHNADGTMQNINFNLHISRGLGNTKSATVPLTLSNIPTIPRHSTVTAPSSFILGNAFTVEFDRASSSFFHYVDIKHGNEMMWSKRVEDSASVTIDRNKMLDRVPNANSASLTLVYTTRTSNGTEIGRSTKSITCNLNAPSPTIGGITHSENVDIVKQIGSYVQSKSRLKVAITGTSPGRGASIRTYKLEVDGQILNASNGVTQPISKSGTLPIKATVIDSRGKSASKSVDISVLSYTPPKISSLRVFRATSSGAEDDYGTYVKMEVGYRITALNAKNSKSVEIVAGSHNKTVVLESYEEIHTELLSGFNVNNTYTYTIELHDLFGKTVTTAVIPTGAVTMLWGRDWVSVGTAESKGSGTLNVRGDLYQHGKRVIDFNSPPDTYGGSTSFNNYWRVGAIQYTGSANANAAPGSPKMGAGRLEVYPNGDYTNANLNQPWLYVTQEFTSLAGQKATRMYGTDGNGKGSWSSWKKFLREDDIPNPIKDHVIETGSNSNGSWRKWYSGIMEMWGSGTYSGSGADSRSKVTLPTSCIFDIGRDAIVVQGRSYSPSAPIYTVFEPTNTYFMVIGKFLTNGNWVGSKNLYWTVTTRWK